MTWTTTHSETTVASPQAIWQRWSTVSAWPEQDPLMEAASIAGPFAVGTVLTLKPKGSPKTSVRLMAVNPAVGFTSEGKLPFGRLRFTHSLETTPDQRTTFTHTITISGPLSRLFGALLGKRLQHNLPTMMQNIARLAEKSNDND